MKHIFFMSGTVMTFLLILIGCSSGFKVVQHPDGSDREKLPPATWWSQDPEKGDFWIGVNLQPDPKGFRRYDTTKYGFALNFRTLHYIPDEIDYGVVLWVARPGPNPIPPLGERGSLKLGWDLTQNRDFVIGGRGIEVDGDYYPPFGRFVHATPKDSHHINWTGILKNVFLNLEGRDDTTKESWFVGFMNDGFNIERAPEGSQLKWDNLFHVSNDGKIGIGTTEPSSALDIATTDGALIVPRLTTKQRDLVHAVNGMIIYNTTSQRFNFFENGAWVVK